MEGRQLQFYYRLDLAHRKLDEAVFAAYGWPPDLTDDQILERLLDLNIERAAYQWGSKHITWFLYDFQNEATLWSHLTGEMLSQSRNERNSNSLWILIVAAIVIRLAYYRWPRITGSPEVDGLLVIFLGFYICARAAANFLTFILYELDSRRSTSGTGSDVKWLSLNALVMLSGLVLVVTGSYRFFSRVI